MENIPPRHNTLLTGWRKRPRAGILIPPLLSGEANAKDGGTAPEIDDMLWVAVEPTVVAHFAVSVFGLNKGQGRDKWPTSAFSREMIVNVLHYHHEGTNLCSLTC
jgi:hypothetical protein